MTGVKTNYATNTPIQSSQILLTNKLPTISVQSHRTMFIQTQETPNPDSLKFLPGVDVLGKGNTMDFPDVESAICSPLGKKNFLVVEQKVTTVNFRFNFNIAKLLFRVEGVRGVFFGGDFITISKQEDSEWGVIKPEIFAIVMDFFASGLPIVSERKPNTDTREEILP